MGDTRPRSSLRGRAAAASVMLVAFAAAIAAAAPAAAGAPAGRVGAAPRLPRDATVLGALPATSVLHVEVSLRPRDPAALRSFAVAVATPGSPLYRHYLPRGAFAGRFGATDAAVAAVERSLRAEGLRPGAPSADHLLIPVTATAGALARAFGIGFQRVRVGGRVAYANTAAPSFPAAVEGDVQGVVGLDDLVVPHAMLVPAKRATAAGRSTAVSRTAASGPVACAQAAAVATSTGPYTTDQLAKVYGFSGLYAAGDMGSAATIGIAELEPFSQSDLSWWESCYSVSTRVTVVPIDGGADTSQSGEAALDLEDVVGLAPGASVRVYEGPNNPNLGDDGFQSLIDIYDRMVATDDDRVITTSWGACESDIYYYDSNIFGSESTIFQEAASQGESVFAAAGDAGSEDCYLSDGSTGLGVDDPASQWWGVTGVGGTTLPSLTNSANQTVWNDHTTYGGGGGTSGWWTSMPSYQSGAAPSLGVDNATYSDGAREVPDVSSDADPDTGLVYYYQGALGAIGGTSLGAPLWAALTALVDSYGSCVSSPVGFANPVLYSAAGSNYAGTFTDVKGGENDVTGSNGGWYPAYAGYDMASGLGTPNAFGLASHLCVVAPAAPASVSATGIQSSTAGNGEALVSWTAPSSNGGAAIDGYTITPSPACSGCGGTSVGAGLSSTVTGLTPGKSYIFGVTATNSAGLTGPAGTSASVLVPATVPGAPAGVSACTVGSGGCTGSGQIVVSWTAAAPYGSAVTSYTLVPSPACAACGTLDAGTATSKAVSGLTPGGSYTFTVTAHNAVGAGQSATSNAASAPAAAPAVPAGLKVAAGPVSTPGDGQASLSWTAPFDDGAPITGYTVSATPACPGCHGLGTVSGTATARAVSGLVPGTAYVFDVSAINRIGTGAPAASGRAAFYTVPSAPTVAAPTLSGAGVKVSFRAPAQSGGEAETAYVVTPSPACPGCHGTTTSSTSTVVTGLTPGVTYRFMVKAVDHAGTGPASAASAAVLFPLPDGYWLAARDGAVFALGAAPAVSGTRTTSADPVVGITSTPDGKGVFLTTADGTVTASGDAKFHGDLPAERVLRTDIVSIMATQDGGGYWLVGADGEVYPFGDAPFHGDLLSLPKPVLVSDVVGMVACAGDAGYLLIGSDGGVFAFGKTHFYGSLPGIGVKVHDIRAILPSATNTGYVLVGADGGAFVFGTGTRFFGSLPGRGIKVSDVVGLAITRDGGGYYMAGANGTVYAFGDARVYPTPAGVRANLPVAAIAGV